MYSEPNQTELTVIKRNKSYLNNSYKSNISVFPFKTGI